MPARRWCRIPGYLLVRAAIEAGIAVQAVPGPSAVLVALAVSGLPVERFCFEGFLPARSAARRERLRTLALETRTLVFFEAPHRIVETLEDLATGFGARARGLRGARTDQGARERISRQPRATAANRRAKTPISRAARSRWWWPGSSGPEATPDDAFVARAFELISAELPPSRAAAVVAALTGRRKQDVYNRNVKAQDKGAQEDENDASTPEDDFLHGHARTAGGAGRAPSAADRAAGEGRGGRRRGCGQARRAGRGLRCGGAGLQCHRQADRSRQGAAGPRRCGGVGCGHRRARGRAPLAGGDRRGCAARGAVGGIAEFFHRSQRRLPGAAVPALGNPRRGAAAHRGAAAGNSGGIAGGATARSSWDSSSFPS